MKPTHINIGCYYYTIRPLYFFCSWNLGRKRQNLRKITDELVLTSSMRKRKESFSMSRKKTKLYLQSFWHQETKYEFVLILFIIVLFRKISTNKTFSTYPHKQHHNSISELNDQKRRSSFIYENMSTIYIIKKLEIPKMFSLGRMVWLCVNQLLLQRCCIANQSQT